MALSFQSRQFQEALADVSNLETLEEREAALEKRGISTDDFMEAYSQYDPIRNKVKSSILEKYNQPNLDSLTPEQREEYQDKLDDRLISGNFVSRILGRAVGDTVKGTIDFVDMLADTTETGQKLTGWISETVDQISDEYIPDSVKEYASEIFDPYHGEGMAAGAEEGAAFVAGLLVPSTALLKGMQAGMKATTALSPATRLVSSRIARTAQNTLGARGASIAGTAVKGAGLGTAYSAVEPLYGDIDRNLKEVGIDPEGLTREEKYLEYYKQQFPTNLVIDAAIGAVLPGVGKLVGKGYQKALGTNTMQKLGSYASNNKLSRFIKENLTSQRGVDDITFSAGIKRNEAAQRALKEAEGISQDLKRAVNSNAQLRSMDKIQRQDLINDALLGDAQALNTISNMSPDVSDIITRMRTNIDDASNRLKGNLVGNSKLRAVIDSKLGVYLNRSYDVFDDPVFRREMVDRIRKFKPDDQIVQDAANFIKSNIGGNTSDTKVQRILLSMIRESSEDEFERDFKQLQKAFTTGPSGVLKRRKDLPPELTAFYGAVKDPTTQYSKTMEKLSRLNAEVDFIDDIKQNLISKGLAVDVNNPQALRENFTKASAVLDERLRKVFGYAPSKDVKNDLEKLYIDPTYAKFMREGLDDWVNPDNKFFKMYLGLKGMSQAAKTVYNPATHVANTIGQASILAANGMIPTGKAAKKATDYVIKNLAGKSSEEFGKYVGKLSELGIVNSNVGLGVIRKNLQQAGRDPYTWIEKAGRSRILNAPKKINEKIFQAYQMEDDIFKIMHFEKTKDYLKKAFPNMAENELDRLASQRTRDLMPNYAQVSKAIQGLRASPFGDFISFPAEMIRVTKNLGKYALKDAMSGNAALQKEAAKKLAGLTTVGMLPSMAMEYSRIANNISNDDQNAIDALSPNYEAFSNKIFLSPVNKDKNNHIGYDYLRLSSLDPFDYIKSMASATHQIINSVDMDGGKFSIDNRPEFNKAATALLENQLTPFFGPSMVTEGLLKMAQGRELGESFIPASNFTGKFLTDVGVPDFLASGLSYALDPLTPGFMGWVNKKNEYLQSGMRSRGGATINPEEVDFSGLFGMGKRRADLGAGLNFQLAPFERAFNGASGKVRREIANQNATPDDIFNAWASSQKDRLKAQEELQAAMEAYRQLGFTNRDIVQSMSINKNETQQAKRLKLLTNTENNYFIPEYLNQGDILINRQSPTGRQLPEERIRKAYESLLYNRIK